MAPDSQVRSLPYVNLAAQAAAEGEELRAAVETVLASGEYILGRRVEEFEEALAAYLGVKHAIGVNSGTDALILGLEALGIGRGDEVITPPNSFVASASAIVRVGARPVFVDVLPDQNMDPDRIAAAITPRTRAIMPVHLTGRSCRMDAIMEIARRHGLAVIEDAAQAIGTKYLGRMAGTFGDVGSFSCHPLKNLNACGDAGFIATARDDVAEKVRLLRNIGLKDRNTVLAWGTVSRLDPLQAVILRLRLKRVDGVIESRRRNAEYYGNTIRAAEVFVPPATNAEFNTYHTFVIQAEDRDRLKQYLEGRGIGTAIHYPVPIHLQPVARDLGYRPGDFPVSENQAKRILTLPVHQFLAERDLAHIAQSVNAFYG